MLLSSCATMRSYELVQTEKVASPTDMNTKVKEVFEVAQKCWGNSPIPLIKMGTKVTQTSSNDRVEVVAVWYTHLAGETDPFFKFVFTNKEKGVEITFIEREHYYFQKNAVLEDARRWTSGDYSCS